MQLTIERAALLKALGHVQSVVERRNTIPILSNVLLSADRDRLTLLGHRPRHGDRRRGRGPGERRGPDHRPGPHPLRDRPQAARRRRGLAELHRRRPAPGGPGRPLALQPAGAAGRRLPGHVDRRPRRHAFTLAKERPDPADRQDPLRRLDRGDALLSERPLSPHRGRGRHRRCCAPWPPTATAWPWPRCPRPRAPPAAPGVIVPRKTIDQVRRLLDDGRGPVEVQVSPQKIRFEFGQALPDLQGHRRRLPRLHARHPQGQRQAGRHRQHRCSPRPSTASPPSRPRRAAR